MAKGRRALSHELNLVLLARIGNALISQPKVPSSNLYQQGWRGGGGAADLELPDQRSPEQACKLSIDLLMCPTVIGVRRVSHGAAAVHSMGES